MEIGITLSPAHQGRGYATEAIECLLDFVFGSLGKHRVSCSYGRGEPPRSARCSGGWGSGKRPTSSSILWFKGQWGSEFVFALLEREWEELRKRICT